MDLDEAQKEALRLMGEHGLQGWKFRWDDGRRTFGRCWHSKKEISLSQRLTKLNSRDKVIETILHEIAHAHAGHAAGHGPTWRAAAVRIGARPVRCFGPEVTVPPRYTKIKF